MTAKKTTEIATVKKKNGGARPGAGRKPFIPTEAEKQLVADLSGNGLPYEQIAAQIRGGVSIDTIQRHFRPEITVGQAEANQKIAQCLFNKAIGGDTTALIWWTKSRMRWSETQKHEHTGKGGAPIAVSAVDFRGLSDEELTQMESLLSKASSVDE